MVVAALCASGCKGTTAPCKAGTLFVHLDFDTASVAADTLQISVTIAGNTKQGTPITHVVGVASGSIEVDFASGYPAGQAVTVNVAASSGGSVIGTGQAMITLGHSCQSLSISITGGSSMQSCTQPSDCSSGFCVDGYCCNRACEGQCEACDVTPGTCAQVTSGQPHGTRASCAGMGTTCGGSCGTQPSVCDYPGTSVSCRDQSCSNSTKTLAATCDGHGSCPTAQTQSCGAFQCMGSDCSTSCTSASECVSPAMCIGGVCKGTLATGTSCTANGECQTGFCADGYCCDNGCTGQCEACNINPGTCSQVSGAPNTNKPPCANTGSTCGGVCASSRTKCDYPTVQCRMPSCTLGVATLPDNCDGNGNCPTLRTQSCAPFSCGATTCNQMCNMDSDCAPNQYCNGTTCMSTAPLGHPCTVGSTPCGSTICADGVCCDNACGGQCQACNSSGHCVAVTGAPHSGHTACTNTGGICSGACDGSNQSACVYAPATKLCNTACTNNATETDYYCDTLGSCNTTGTAKPCSNGLACPAASTTCNTSCSNNGDCQSGYNCVGNSCTPCGTVGIACCGGVGGTCGPNADDVCNSSGTCFQCGVLGAACCTSGNACGNYLGCGVGGTPGICGCGTLGNTCCVSGGNYTCSGGNKCGFGDSIQFQCWSTCGGLGQACCIGAVECTSGTCGTCAGSPKLCCH
jgi:hypothetical protein